MAPAHVAPISSAKCPFLRIPAEDEYGGIRILVQRRLEHEMIRSAESRQPQVDAVAQIGQSESPVSNGAGAQQGSCFRIRDGLGNGVGEVSA